MTFLALLRSKDRGKRRGILFIRSFTLWHLHDNLDSAFFR
jgi:hypothetical protein